MSFISRLFKSVLLLVISLLVGCTGAEPNVALKQEFWSERPKQPVVVAADKSAKGDMYIVGGVGLLDLAIIKAATHQFQTYLNQYDPANFYLLQTEFVADLRKHGIPAEKYSDSIELSKLQVLPGYDDKAYERKDFRPLAVQLKNNRLLLLNINVIGATRNYYGMIPTSAPRAVCDAEARLVDLEHNKTLWRFLTRQEVKVEGKWDQPPDYPNFTGALNKAVSHANQAIVSDFLSSAPLASAKQ